MHEIEAAGLPYYDGPKRAIVPMLHEFRELMLDERAEYERLRSPTVGGNGGLRALNPNLAITEAMRLSELTALGLIPQRMAASVAGTLGIVRLLLCAIGIYGVTSYSVTQRTREIGIRVAFGAERRNVLGLVLRQGLVLAAIGTAIGVMIAAVGSTFLESLLYGVRGFDPLTFGTACVLFALVTLIASYIPARRATRVDPVVALRNE